MPRERPGQIALAGDNGVIYIVDNGRVSASHPNRFFPLSISTLSGSPVWDYRLSNHPNSDNSAYFISRFDRLYRNF